MNNFFGRKPHHEAYTITDPEDIKRAVKALDLCLCLWDIDQHLRSEYKYGDNEAAYAIREKVYEIMNQYDINLDSLIQ